MIREPNDVFDLVAFSGYCKNPDLYDMTRIELLKEVVRVTKIGGVIILTARANMPETQNFFANKLLRSYSESVNERTFSEKELSEDLINAGLTKYEIFNYEGMLTGIGWKT